MVGGHFVASSNIYCSPHLDGYLLFVEYNPLLRCLIWTELLVGKLDKMAFLLETYM